MHGAGASTATTTTGGCNATRYKFDHMLEFARALPDLRASCAKILSADDELTRDRVLACATRLLDLGFFRIGTEGYAEENQSYGLATIQKRHVRLKGDVVTFDYVAKAGKRRVQTVVDPEVTEIVTALKRRRGGGPGCWPTAVHRRWTDVKSTDINVWIKDQTGGDFSAKDFRTWSATVLASVALAVSKPRRRRRPRAGAGRDPGRQGSVRLPGDAPPSVARLTSTPG